MKSSGGAEEVEWGISDGLSGCCSRTPVKYVDPETAA